MLEPFVRIDRENPIRTDGPGRLDERVPHGAFVIPELRVAGIVPADVPVHQGSDVLQKIGHESAIVASGPAPRTSRDH